MLVTVKEFNFELAIFLVSNYFVNLTILKLPVNSTVHGKMLAIVLLTDICGEIFGKSNTICQLHQNFPTQIFSHVWYMRTPEHHCTLT